jgi:hypothetical protein
MDIKMAPKLAMHNKESLEKVSECACYYCYKIFSPSEIKEWVDRNKDTALCPYCFVDAVLPINEEGEKDNVFLIKIHEYWF